MVDLHVTLDVPHALNLDVSLMIRVALVLDVQIALAHDLALVLAVAAGFTIAEADTAIAEDRSLRPMQTTAFLSVFKRQQR